MYYTHNGAGSDDAELLEYAPQPNINVYILCADGKYYATIRRDSGGCRGPVNSRLCDFSN